MQEFKCFMVIFDSFIYLSLYNQRFPQSWINTPSLTPPPPSHLYPSHHIYLTMLQLYPIFFTIVVQWKCCFVLKIQTCVKNKYHHHDTYTPHPQERYLGGGGGGGGGLYLDVELTYLQKHFVCFFRVQYSKHCSQYQTFFCLAYSRQNI